MQKMVHRLILINEVGDVCTTCPTEKSLTKIQSFLKNLLIPRDLSQNLLYV